jgi:hypothetical protein
MLNFAKLAKILCEYFPQFCNELAKFCNTLIVFNCRDVVDAKMEEVVIVAAVIDEGPQ